MKIVYCKKKQEIKLIFFTLNYQLDDFNNAKFVLDMVYICLEVKSTNVLVNKIDLYVQISFMQ